MPELSIEQKRALALAQARLRVQRQSAASPEVSRRQEELAAEEKAARASLAKRQRREREYQSSLPGRILESPFKLFGAETPSEERLRRERESTQETLQRVAAERQYLERKGQVAPKPTVGQRITGGLAAIPRGAIEGTSQFLGTLGILGAEGEQQARSAEAAGTKFAESIGLGRSETAQFDPWQRRIEDVGGGFGSIIPYVVSEVAGRKVAPLTKAAPYVARGAQALLGTGQGAAQARQQMDQFEQETGQKVDPTTRRLVQLGGGTVGLSELLPIGRMLNVLPPAARATAARKVSEVVARTGVGKLAPEAARTALREAAQGIERSLAGRVVSRGAAPEALQEGASQFAQNLIAQQAYNPEQDLTEGVAYNALIGGVVGGTIRSAAEMAGTLGNRAAANRATMLQQAIKSEQAVAQSVAEAAGVPEPTLRGAEPTEAPAAKAALTEPPAPTGPTPAELQARRVALVRSIAADTSVVDKIGAFNAALEAEGLGAPNMIETTALRDLMRRESELETTAGQVEDIRNRELQVARMDIIEPTLYNPGISEPNKIKKINADLRRKGMEQITPEELNRVYGYEAVSAVFGPQGEVARKEQAAAQAEDTQRAAMLQEAVASEAPDKYRAFATLLDEAGFGEPTAAELEALQGEPTAGIEEFIPSAEGRDAQRAKAAEDAAFEEAVAAREEALLDQEIDYDSDYRIQENEALFEDAQSRLGDVETYPQLVALLKKLKKEGVLDEDAEEAMREAADDAEKGEKYDAAYYALSDAIDEARDARAEDLISEIDDEHYSSVSDRARAEVTAEREAQAQAAPVEEAPVAEAPVEAPAAPVPSEPPVQLMRPEPLRPAPGQMTAGEAITPGEALETREDILARLENMPVEEAPAVEAAPVEELQAEEGPAPAAVEEAPTETPALPGGLPPTPNRPRVETVGFAADAQQRTKNWFSWAIRKFNYKYQDAVDYTRALAASYGVARLPENMNVAQKFELLESRKIGSQLSLKRWFIQPLEDKIKELGLDPQDVGMWLWARAAPARNLMVFDRSNGEITDGSGMSDSDAQAILDMYDAQGLTPALKQVAKLHDALVDYMGKERVKAGLLSKQGWKELRAAQPFYTPLKGFSTEGDMNEDADPKEDMRRAREAYVQSGGRTRIKEFVASEGRESMPFNPLFNLFSDAQFAIARIERNRVGQTLLDNAMEDPETHADVVKVYSEKPADGAQTIAGDALNDMRRRASGGPRTGTGAFMVKKDGETYYLDFQNTDAGNAMYRAFANMTPKELGAFLRRVQGFSNAIKSLKTRFNPSYLLGTAWQRDFQEAILTNLAAQGVKGGPAEGKKIAAQSAKYMFSPEQAKVIGDFLYGREPTSESAQELTLLFDQFLKDGGAVGHSMVTDAEDHAKAFRKAMQYVASMQKGNPIAAAQVFAGMGAEFLDTVSQVIDMQARFSTYRAALDADISRDDAASLALDSSLNLTRRGEWAPMLDTWSFFWSAGVEGGRKFVNQGMTSRNARKLILAAVNMGVLVQLWNYFMGGDDDEDGRKNIYDVPDATRQSRAVIYYGPGTNDYVAIPTAFSFGFAKYAGEEIAAAVLGDKTPYEAAVSAVDAFRSMALPVRGSSSDDLLASVLSIGLPDIVQPLIDLEFNSNYFGAPIYKEDRYGTRPASEQGRENTAAMWKWLAREVNSMTGGTSTVAKGLSRQPEWYQYIANQYGGGLFDFGADIASGEMPNLGRITGRGGEYAPMNNFYANTKDMDALSAARKEQDENPEAWAADQRKFPLQTSDEVLDAYEAAQKELRGIRKGMNEGEYGSVEDYHAATNEVYKQFNRTFNEAKKRK